MTTFFSSLLIGPDLKFGAVELDAKLVEDFTLTAEATEHPVDEGSDISDHVIKHAPRYVLEGAVSDTPLGYVTALGSLADNAVSAIRSGASSLSGGLIPTDASSKRSVQAFLSLIEMWQAGQPLEIQTAMGLWTNLVIEELTTRVDNNTSNMLRFTARLKHIRIESSELVPTDTKAPGVQSIGGVSITGEGIKQLSPVEPETLDAVQRARA